MFVFSGTAAGRSALATSVIAALAVTACNDSAAESAVSSAAKAEPAGVVEQAVQAVATAADINERNHVCFTMDVNNVKCVLGDIVAYVPQGILESDKADLKKDTDDKKAKKTDSKDKDAAAKEEEEANARAQLAANQKALNEARSLVFVAKYCDMDKTVVYSKEGVACIFKPHSLYDAGAAAELNQYNINLLNADAFFAGIKAMGNTEHFTDAEAFGKHGGYRIFLNRGDAASKLKIDENTKALITTKRLDMNGNVMGLYQEELTLQKLNAQMKILTKGLVKGDRVKLVFDVSLDREQPLWRTTSLEFGQPYIWEVEVNDVQPIN